MRKPEESEIEILKMEKAFESKNTKVNFRKTNVMECGSKRDNKSKVDPCAKCEKKVRTNLVLCTKEW